MRRARRTSFTGRALRALVFLVLALAALAAYFSATGTTPIELWHYLQDGPGRAPPPLPDL